MSDLLVDAQTPPLAPAAGQAIVYVDTLSKGLLSAKDEFGYVRSIGPTNFSTAAQAIPAATRTYITGSAITVPGSKLQVGTCFHWRLNMTKTAAGAAASTFDIAVGTAGTVADTARATFTKPAGSAAIDEAWVDVSLIVRGPVSASGVIAGQFSMTHNLAATGHALIPCVVVTGVSAAFDITPAGLIVGLCLTSGALDAITIQIVQAAAWNL